MSEPRKIMDGMPGNPTPVSPVARITGWIERNETPTTLGIDPGQSGAIAVLRGSMIETYKLSNTEADIAEWLRQWCKPMTFAAIERVHSMPRQGVASSFKFGRNYGFLRGLLIALKVPFEEVTPQKWQREMGCLSKGDKNVTKSKAQQLFPSMKITHANADALLIAEWCRRKR